MACSFGLVVGGTGLAIGKREGGSKGCIVLLLTGVGRGCRRCQRQHGLNACGLDALFSERIRAWTSSCLGRGWAMNLLL